LKKMKNRILITTLLVLAVSLSACGASPAGTRTAPTGSSTGEANNANSLSTLNMLAVGIFKLDGTANDVTASQAKDLLVLWEAYQQVSSSDTAAPEEKAALVSQLQSSMTTDQMAAISALNLKASDVYTLMRDRGLTAATTTSGSSGTTTGGSTSGSTSSSRTSGSGTSRRSSGTGGGGGFAGGGNFPAGGGAGFPGGGAGFPGGEPNGSTTPNATMQARIASGGGFVSSGMTKAIIDALIQLLQKKAGV
jgi:hypothetical protein